MASPRTLRLTIKSEANQLTLVSVEHLPMITPPQPGETPVAGRHSGYWFELRDTDNRVLAHRLIDTSMLNSVEVHEPDGTLRRVFGAMRETTFEVLLPDLDHARAAVLVGSPLTPVTDGKRTVQGSRDLARFDISQ